MEHVSTACVCSQWCVCGCGCTLSGVCVCVCVCVCACVCVSEINNHVHRALLSLLTIGKKRERQKVRNYIYNIITVYVLI